MEELLEASRRLRKEQTQAEENLWTYLRNRKFYGYKFKRQAVFTPYIVDGVRVN